MLFSLGGKFGFEAVEMGFRTAGCEVTQVMQAYVRGIAFKTRFQAVNEPSFVGELKTALKDLVVVGKGGGYFELLCEKEMGQGVVDVQQPFPPWRSGLPKEVNRIVAEEPHMCLKAF